LHARTTHASLLERLADGSNDAAWREFLARYGDLLRGFARRRGLAPDEVEDVVQDVLTALLPAMAKFRYDPQRGRFRGFLKTLAVRATARRASRNARTTTLEEFDPADEDRDGGSDIEGHWEDEWRQYHIRTAMQTIEAEFTSRDRAAFHRYAVVGDPVGVVAEALGISTDQVYQVRSRIVRRLGELVSAQIAEEG